MKLEGLAMNSVKYVALLRGINVGGKNKVNMADLRAAFGKNGFPDAQTYINSGNVIFSGDGSDVPALQAKVEGIVRELLGVDIAAALLSGEELTTAVANAPKWWNADEASKHNAIFVIAPATVETILAEVGESKPEYEKVAAYGRVIFWSAPLKTFSRTRWSRVVDTSAYRSITIRNANTTLKLAELVAVRTASV